MHVRKYQGEENMFLELLTDQQKELCIELAINLASSDGNFSQKERMLIEGYCADAGVTYDFRKEVLPLQAIIENLIIDAGLTEKKIIIFEMMRLAVVDNVFHENEKDLIHDLAVQFEVDLDYVRECEETIKEYVAIQEKMNRLVIN